MLSKAILWLSGVVFTSYGLACLVSPALPAGYAGLIMSSGDAYAEIGAMYGGLQAGVGIYCIICALKPSLTRGGLLLLAIAIGSLAFGRAYSTYTTDDAVTVYTWAAMIYEFSTATIAAFALQRSGR